jgi:hypothetical protein
MPINVFFIGLHLAYIAPQAVSIPLQWNAYERRRNTRGVEAADPQN